MQSPDFACNDCGDLFCCPSLFVGRSVLPLTRRRDRGGGRRDGGPRPRVSAKERRIQMAGSSFHRHRRATTLALIVALVCAGAAGAQKHLVTFKLRKNNRDRVVALAFSPDGLTLAARINGYVIALYDVESQKQVGKIKPGGSSGG